MLSHLQSVLGNLTLMSVSVFSFPPFFFYLVGIHHKKYDVHKIHTYKVKSAEIVGKIYSLWIS